MSDGGVCAEVAVGGVPRVLRPAGLVGREQCDLVQHVAAGRVRIAAVADAVVIAVELVGVYELRAVVTMIGHAVTVEVRAQLRFEIATAEQHDREPTHER